MNWRVWVRGLVAALVSGAATGVLAPLAAPEAFAGVAWHTIAKVAAVGAAVGLAGYLKQSPLPAPEP